ncbi:MAG: hypothetical protein JST38_05745, partial [Bacteroidetes bacterium]|nr:hypothetical protein [Bacteroidota bacterium]
MKPNRRLLAHALALAVPLCTWAQAEVEPNNNIAQATPLWNNSSIGGSTGTCAPTDNSTDYFSYSSPMQGVLEIITNMSNSGTTDLAVTVQLLNNSGSLLQSYTVTAGGNNTAVLDTLTYPNAGVGLYHIVVINPSTTVCTSYIITCDMGAPLFANDAEPNQNIAQASDTLAAGVDHDGQVSFYYGDQWDYFRILLPDDGLFSVTVSAEHASNVTTDSLSLYLHNSSGTTLQTWRVPIGASGIPTTTTITRTCMGKGAVYFLDFYSPDAFGVSYRFNYSVTPPMFADDTEPNQNTAQALDTLQPGVNLQGRLNFEYGDNGDYHRILAPDQGVLNVTISAEHAGSSTTDSLSLYLMNSSGSTILIWKVGIGANGAPNTQTFTHTCIGDGAVYFLAPYYATTCGVSYQLSYTVTPALYANDAEPNQNTAQAFVTHSDTAYDGRISFDYDNNLDYYRVQAPNDGVLSVNVSAESAGAAGTMTVYLLNSSGGALETWTANVGGSGVAEDTTFIHHCTGTENVYYLEFYSPSVCGVSYRFSYSVAAPVYADDAEPNQNLAQAFVTHSDTAYDGRVSFYYDNTFDFYRVQAPNDGVFSVNVSAENAGAAGTMTVYLLNSSGSALETWTANVGGSGVAEDTTFIHHCTGTEQVYYLEFYYPSVCGVSYRFSYSVAAPVYADDAEPNQNLAQAFVTHSDTAYDGRVSFYYDNPYDYYRVQAPDDGVFSVNVSAENAGAAGTMTVYLLNSSGSALETWTANVGGSGVAEDTTFIHHCTGTENVYYLEFYNPSVCGVSYRFSYSVAEPLYADDAEPNQNLAQAPLINLNDSVVEGRVGFGYDNNDDYFKVNHPGGVLRAITSAENAGAAGTMSVYLRNSGGSAIFTNSAVAVGGAGVPALDTTETSGSVPAGTYYIEVYSSSICGVSYRLYCNDDDNDGVCNGSDLCANTPNGEGVNTDGCSCSQVTVDDGDPCTLDECLNGDVTHTFQDADGDLTCDANDGCPNDPNKISAGACGCGNPDVATTWYADTDGDGLGDPNNSQAGFTCIQPPGYVADNTDGCPSVTGTVGSACDDGNPNTTGDALDANCNCVGSPVNCDDGDPCTVDTWDGNQCVHTFQDTDGDGTCDANDGCVNDPDKTAPGACGCGVADVATTWYADTDGDGLGDPNNSVAGYTCIQPPGYVADNTDGCPSVTGTVGSACDDGNPNTSGDALDASCNCVGTPVNCDDGDPCTVDTWDGNQCVHTFQDTDGDGTCDANDGCVNDPDKTAPGACGCGVADVATTW